MKKKVLCVFFLSLYLLTACTLLSRKIEKEMATQVQITERRPIGGSISSMTLDPLFYADGTGWLYEVTEGTGWSSGLRTTLVPEERWSYEDFGRFLRFAGGRNYWFVETASRHPSHGGMAEIVEAFEAGSDQYLLHSPEGIPEGLELPETWTVTARTENTLLLDVPDGTYPFFQHRVKILTGIPREESVRIISLTEAEGFLEALPSVTMVFLALLAGVVFWAFACLLSIRPEENRPFLWLNAALVIAALGFLGYALKAIDLPASMLPGENIFHWQYYQEEFSLIFDTLRSLEMPGLLQTRDRLTAQCAGILGRGILGILAVVFAQAPILRIIQWKKRRKRYVGKYLRKKKT